MNNWDISKRPIIVIIATTVTTILFMITIYETFRIPPLKEERERLEKLLNQQEKLDIYTVTIKDLNDIIDKKMDTMENKINIKRSGNKKNPVEKQYKKENFDQIISILNQLI